MTDQQALTEVQYALLEPTIDGGQTWDSLAWTRAEVLNGVNDGQWRIQRALQFGAVRLRLAVGAGTATVALPPDWITTVAAVWEDSLTGARTILAPADPTSADHAVPDWQTPGTPLVYMDRDQASLTTRLAPIPAATGVFDLLYCPRGAELQGSGASFTLPLELAYGAKWHALSNLLGKVGRLQDAARADYAETRVQLLLLLGDLLLKGLA
jgi:hypothetical protein